MEKFTISQLYKAHTMSEVSDIFSLTEDILSNLDEYALKELSEGYSYDIDKLFLDIVQESDYIINSGGGAQSFSFSYLESLTESLDKYLKDLSLAYFVSNTITDFNIEPYHLEWFNLIQLYRFLCVLAARGHSKSFCFSYVYILWLAWKYKGEGKLGKEITLITAEEGLSGVFIDMIKKQIEDNPILYERLFPGTSTGSWAKSYIETKNGFKLVGKGLGSSLRGLHTDIICDDLLDESNFYNAKIRQQTIDIFNSVIMNIPLPRTGKVTIVGCVTGDTLVLDEKRGFCNIAKLSPSKDLKNQGLYDLENKVLDSYNDFAQNTKFWVNGLCNTTKVILDNKYQIVGSDIHPLWTFNGKDEVWKKIPELKIGDIVEIKDNEEIKNWGTKQAIVLPELPYCKSLNMPEFLNEEIAYLLGVFCAEGSIHSNGKQVNITNNEINFDFTKKYNIEFKSYDGGKHYSCSRKIFREWLINLFGINCCSFNKEIPNIVLKSPKSIIKYFLRGYFDGDGTCNGYNISCTTISYTLAKQIQYVLAMGFGIHSSIYIYKKEQRNTLNSIQTKFDTYNINLDNYNTNLFLNRIGFGLSRKNICKKVSDKNSVCLPTPTYLLRIIKETGNKKYKITTGIIPEQVLKRNGYITRKRLLGIIEYFEKIFNEEDKDIITKLKNYANKCWRKIESIIPNGKDYTYDFVIPSHNIFIGNGIKNHQTPFHQEDLYGYLKKAKGWRVFEYPGIYPDGSVLSPERFSLQELLDKKSTIGSLSFSREILMKPISNATSLFPMKIMKMNLVDTVRMTPNRFNFPVKFVKLALGVDLAISANTNEGQDADYFCVSIVGLDELKRYWILNLYRDRGLTYLQQVNVVKRLNDAFNPDIIMVESNQYQKMFADLLKDNGLTNVVDRATTAKNKYDFQIGLPAISVLFEQFRIKIPYENDVYTRNLADIIMAEFNSMTFADNKLQSSGGHDDTCMAIWLAITGLNYINNDLVLSFLQNN